MVKPHITFQDKKENSITFFYKNEQDLQKALITLDKFICPSAPKKDTATPHDIQIKDLRPIKSKTTKICMRCGAIGKDLKTFRTCQAYWDNSKSKNANKGGK